MNKDGIWDRLEVILNDSYPIYFNPPERDDKRPNETSWTVFKKFLTDKEEMKEGDKN